MQSRFLGSGAALFGALFALAGNAYALPICATPDDSKIIQHYYSEIRPAAPPPVPARMYRMKEISVVSALSAEHAYGVSSSPDFFDQVWKTVDSWGADTRIGLVFTSGGRHAWNFPSKVPVTQASTDLLLYDMYADEGKGVHGHITQTDVDSIWALQLPTKDAGKYTRIIGFYNKEGDLIVGLYVSEGTKTPDPKAVEGFERTRALLQTQPRICAG